MDLKTVVVNKLSRSGLRKYPLVFSQSLEYLPDWKEEQRLLQEDDQKGESTFSASASMVSFGQQTSSLHESHPLIIGHNPNQTNTNALVSRLKTNDALANPANSFVKPQPTVTVNKSPKAIKKHHHHGPPPATSSNTGSILSGTNNLGMPMPRKSFLRSDSAASNDSLHFNALDFHASGPPALIPHPSQQFPNLNHFSTGSFSNQEFENYYLENHPVGSDGMNEQQYYQDHHNNSNYGEYDNNDDTSDFRHMTNSSHPSQGHHHPHNELLLYSAGNNNNNRAGSRENSLEGKSISSSSHPSMPRLYKPQLSLGNSLAQPSQMTVNMQEPRNTQQQQQQHPHAHYHHKGASGGNYHFPPSGLFEQPSEVSTIVDSNEPHHLQQQQLNNHPILTKQSSASLINANSHQDIINGIVYNQRANNHYNNLLYKTNLANPNDNHPSSVGASYEQFYQKLDDNVQRMYPIDALSITSLSNNSPVKASTRKVSSPWVLSEDSNDNNNNHHMMSHAGQTNTKHKDSLMRRSVLPQINAAEKDVKRESKPLPHSSEALRRLRKEFF
jgi:hypothetical protein